MVSHLPPVIRCWRATAANLGSKESFEFLSGISDTFHILAIENMAGMVGDVQGLSGGALKSIPLLDQEEPDDEEPGEADEAA